MGATRFEALVHNGQRQSCMLAAFATPRGRWIGLVVFGPETSVGIVRLFFDQMVQQLAAVAPREQQPPAADAGGEFRDRAQREPQSALRTVTGMSLVNFTAREITCKIVYYGPGRSGKTTNLQYVYGRVPESRRGRMVSLATQTDRTLFFDFLPLELGTISGFTTKFQLYTVPGAELLQRHPQAGAAGRRRRRVRGRQPGPPLRRQPREPAEPAGQPARAGRRHPPAPGRVPVQQAGPAGRPDPLAGGDGRRAQLPRGAELRRPTPCTAAACSRRSAGISELVLKRLAVGEPGRVTVTLNPLYRFDTLVVGAANRLAVTAAKAVAESPGTVYNPLFVYARPGPGQDPPADGDRPRGPGDQSAARRRVSHARRVRRGLSRRDRRRPRRGLPQAVPRRRPAAGGRRPVPDPPARDAGRAAAAHRRAADQQPPDRAHERPAARRDRGARRSADPALRGRAHHRRRRRPTTRRAWRSSGGRPRSAAPRSATACSRRSPRSTSTTSASCSARSTGSSPSRP